MTSNVEIKQKILSSIFTEKIIFEDLRCRTPKVNEIISLIMLDTNDIQQIKKGSNRKKTIQSLMVVPTGIEPVSKV